MKTLPITELAIPESEVKLPALTLVVIQSRLRQSYPTCFNCQNANVSSGSYDSDAGPGDPAEAWCMLPAAVFGGEEQQELIAEIAATGRAAGSHTDARSCPFFVARAATQCPNCETAILMPEWSWPFWASKPDYEPLAVCSEACREAWDAKADEWERRQEEERGKAFDEFLRADDEGPE